MKVVFHLDSDETPTFELALANITNLLNDVGKADVAVLANGFAVKLFVEKVSTKFRETLKELKERGVKFYVCNNAMKVHGINKEDLFEFCEVVPAGITKLVKLQMEGYTYVKP